MYGWNRCDGVGDCTFQFQCQIKHICVYTNILHNLWIYMYCIYNIGLSGLPWLLRFDSQCKSGFEGNIACFASTSTYTILHARWKIFINVGMKWNEMNYETMNMLHLHHSVGWSVKTNGPANVFYISYSSHSG